MKSFPFAFALCLTSFLTAAPSCLADTDIIKQLTKDIAKAKTEDEKSRLHMYRARNYKNSGNLEMAEKDYDTALAYDHKGWIHLERSRFYMAQGDYHQAKCEAEAARKETPTLAGTAQKLIAVAEKELKKKKRKESPREILLTTRWEATYTRTPTSLASGMKNSRASSGARKATARSRPRRVSRS